MMELNQSTTLTNPKEEIWLRIPGSMIQDIQLEDGTDFIKQYGSYDKYGFEILLTEGNEEENSNYRQQTK